MVPRWIAILGLIGYPVLLVGSILTTFGVTDATQGSGQLWLIVGGLFEFPPDLAHRQRIHLSRFGSQPPRFAKLS